VEIGGRIRGQLVKGKLISVNNKYYLRPLPIIDRAIILFDVKKQSTVCLILPYYGK